jgi:hypothetical protein
MLTIYAKHHSMNKQQLITLLQTHDAFFHASTETYTTCASVKALQAATSLITTPLAPPLPYKELMPS